MTCPDCNGAGFHEYPTARFPYWPGSVREERCQTCAGTGEAKCFICGEPAEAWTQVGDTFTAYCSPECEALDNPYLPRPAAEAHP